MTSSNVPTFGNWENEEDVPYTAYFEKARKVRTSSTNPEEETSDLNRRSKNNRELGETTGNSNKRQGKSVSKSYSYEKPLSPLHKHAKASPLWDGTTSSFDGTGRSKPRSNIHKGDDSPEKGAVVPKFGDWDENNPSSADGYTHIFNKVREERTSASNVTGSSRTPTHSSASRPSDQAKFCCFSWGAK